MTRCRICDRKTDDGEYCDACWHYQQGEKEEEEKNKK